VNASDQFPWNHAIPPTPTVPTYHDSRTRTTRDGDDDGDGDDDDDGHPITRNTLAMTLILAVHKVVNQTAKVSFSMIQLADFIKSKSCPEGMRCHKTFPTSGSVSCSVWDVELPDEQRETAMDAEEMDEQAVALLISWLSEHLNTGDVTHEAYVVQEAFAFGIGDIQRSRAAERAMTTTSKAVKDVDAKLRITERATTIKDSEIVQEAGAALSKAGSTVYHAGAKGVSRIGEFFSGSRGGGGGGGGGGSA